MFQIVLCNCPDSEVAEAIAEKLITDQLAACVNILPKIKSFYRWQGKQECDEEIMLLIKSKQQLFPQLEQTIIALHPYDVVEIIALTIQQGNELYLNWIHDTVKK
ncbi:divalent-cation tolerance protein CutA [Thalassotalea sp. 42_200_T64]|nr:divalent-cation tolerance protein CutA [Thalassotalea sp. 42_200_T64]